MKAQPKRACTEVDNLVNKYLIEVSEKIERLLLLKETLIDLKQHCSTDRTVDECGILKELQKPSLNHHKTGNKKASLK